MIQVSSPDFRKKIKGCLLTVLFLALCFQAGRFAARMDDPLSSSVAASAEGDWGLSFQEAGRPPVGNASSDELALLNARYLHVTDEPVLYLTFDAGYENGNTSPILDALKKHQAPACFFVTGHYLETAPELAKRMIAEGHLVGNHTYHHPDIADLDSAAEFEQELSSLESLFQSATGRQMKKYYRPPRGKLSLSNLQAAKDLGYHTFFWSLAYADWMQDRQPDPEKALALLTSRIHPGAIVLLHSTSETNAAILDELLTRFEQMGYRFGRLSDLTDPPALSASCLCRR